jgi:hypothetical protein
MNGPGSCIPIALSIHIINLISKLFNIKPIIIIFIESYCRVKTLSLTVRILIKILPL